MVSIPEENVVAPYPTPKNLIYWWTIGGVLSLMLGLEDGLGPPGRARKRCGIAAGRPFGLRHQPCSAFRP
jgi:hypothetical protein